MRTGTHTTKAIYGEDAMTATGAYRLKERVERYWRERGHQVSVHIKRMPYIAVAREAAFTIESDMINGLPREVVKQGAQP